MASNQQARNAGSQGQNKAILVGGGSSPASSWAFIMNFTGSTGGGRVSDAPAPITGGQQQGPDRVKLSREIPQAEEIVRKDPQNYQAWVQIGNDYQEALTNIARHSQASEAVLSLQLDEIQVYLTIEDNGVGIPSLEAARRSRSHGLKIMQERAEALEGTLTIRSTPGMGKKIEVVIPLPPRDPEAISQEQSS